MDMNYCGDKWNPKQTYQHNLSCDNALGLTYDNETQSDDYKNVFVTISEELDDIIFPPTAAEIASE